MVKKNEMESWALRGAGHELNHRQRYATVEEIDWLRAMAASIPPDGLVIMLGAGPGIMMAALKDGNQNLRAFVVDHDTCDYMIAHLRQFGPGYVQGVVSFVGDSAAVGTRYSGQLADLLIIDADHTERGVRNDIICWLTHVKPGGYIMCHDYDATGTWFEQQEQYPGVKKAVDELFRNYDIVQRVGTSLIIRNEVVYG